jgi:hypothetical protein
VNRRGVFGGSTEPGAVRGRIRRRPILGGVIDEYEAAAWNRSSDAVAEFWNPTAFHAWLRWMDHLRSADTAQKEQTALVALAQLPRTTSAAALTAGTALGKSVLQRPWYAAQAAREAGESWEAIGDAMGLSGHNAQLWFQSTAASMHLLRNSRLTRVTWRFLLPNCWIGSRNRKYPIT